MLAGLVFVVHDVPWVLQQPFWIDEAWVALTTRMPIAEVSAHTSATPVGFTLLLRAVFWGGDQSYRLLPLAFSAGSVVAAYCLARLLLWRDRRQAVLAGVLAAGAALLVPSALYRNDLKQFTAEAFASLVVLALTANVERRWSRRSLVALVAAIVAAKLVAHTVVFVGSAALLSLTAVAVVQRQWRRAAEVVAAGTASAVGVVAIYLTIDGRGDTANLHRFWGNYFPPTSWPGLRDYLADHYQYLQPYLGFGEVWLASALVLAGIVTLAAAKRPAVALAVPVLLVELVVAGLADQYPLLNLRTSHFLLVTLAVVGALGVAGIAALAARVSFLASLAIAALAAALYLNQSEPYLRGHTSIPHSDVPSQVRYIDKHRRPGDVIVVNLRGGYGFGYYWRSNRPRLTGNPGVLLGWSVTYPPSSRIVVARESNYPALVATLQTAWRMAREGSGRMWILRTFVSFVADFEQWGPALTSYNVTSLGVGRETLLLARHSASAQQLRQAGLREGIGGQVILSWLGKQIDVTPGAVQGSVDRVSTSAQRLRVQGWAADTDRHQDVDWVLVFSNGHLLAANPPGSKRPDVAKTYGKSAELSGYDLTAAYSQGRKPDLSHLRAFAVVGDRASELTVSQQAKEATP